MTLEQIADHIFRWGHSSAERSVVYFREEKKKATNQSIQAVKDRVKSKGLSEKEIEQIVFKCFETKNSIAKAIHTEMDKAVEGL